MDNEWKNSLRERFSDYSAPEPEGLWEGIEQGIAGKPRRKIGLQRKLEGELRSVIGLGFKVKLVEPKGIERSTGKAKRVIDKRVI